MSDKMSVKYYKKKKIDCFLYIFNVKYIFISWSFKERNGLFVMQYITTHLNKNIFLPYFKLFESLWYF